RKTENVPSNVEQALKSKGWKDAMNVEMDALIRSETWDKCALPHGKKLVGCRWIFTVNYTKESFSLSSRNSASALERATTFCLLLLHVTRFPPTNVK
nr:putative reverse transcriptase, RNA-dependent DNA polymerase [Tanacetum cinerariifolium]